MNAGAVKGHLAMGVANSIWGLMSPVAKIVMAGGVVSPLVVTDLRIAGAMVLFWALSLCFPHEHVPHRDLFRFFFAALFAVILNQGTYLFGVRLTSPADASILTTSMPLWAMILAAILLKDPITGRKVIGIAAGAGGALLLILSSGQNVSTVPGDFPILGDLLVTCAQLSFAFYIVKFRDLITRYSLVTVMKWMFTYAFICVIPFSAHSLIHTQWLALGMPEILALLFIVVCATFLSYLLAVTGQRLLRPTVCAMYNYVQPVVACIVAIYMGLDSFSLLKLCAVALIFFGVFEVTHARTREEIAAHHAAKARKRASESATEETASQERNV